MKKGIIIYSEEDLNKNLKFIEMCREVLIKKGIQLETVVINKNEQQDIENMPLKEEILFAINRSRNHSIAQVLEVSGIRVFNNSNVVRICNNKWTTFQYAGNWDVPVMDTVMISHQDIDNNEFYQDKIPYPRVVKSLDGHGGSQVFLVENSYQEKEKAKEMGGDYIAQKLADAKGNDIRVYVIGEEIIVAMCRSAKDGFKSNFSLGGKSGIYTLNDKERALVNKVIEKLKPDYIGVDLIYDGDRLVLNEIEDAVGARMVYENTDIPIVEMYMEYVVKEIESYIKHLS